jgi:hypothetical protein
MIDRNRNRNRAVIETLKLKVDAGTSGRLPRYCGLENNSNTKFDNRRQWSTIRDSKRQ